MGRPRSSRPRPSGAHASECDPAAVYCSRLPPRSPGESAGALLAIAAGWHVDEHLPTRCSAPPRVRILSAALPWLLSTLSRIDRSVYHTQANRQICLSASYDVPMTTAAVRAAPVSAARQRILETAFRLFYAHGIRGVGVDRIIAESGVAKATFYKHFPAKDDLVVAYLDKVDDTWTGQLRYRGRGRRHRACRPAGRHVRRARDRLPPRRLSRLRVHQRRRRERRREPRSTTAR